MWKRKILTINLAVSIFYHACALGVLKFIGGKGG